MTIISSSLSKGDDGTALVNRTSLAQLSGVRKQLTRGEFNAAMTAERSRISSNSTGLYQQGEEFSIVGEMGHRTWFLSTGGSDAANAAASHGRTAVLPGGVKTVVLVAESNTVTPTTGAPSGGVDGDVKVDNISSLYYVRTAGAWIPVGATVISGGALVSAVWTPIPSIFRIRLTGSGTCVLDSRDALGNVTTGIASYTALAETNRIEFPYAGESATQIRATLTGTTAAEVI